MAHNIKRVNINRASEVELQGIIHIGPVRAKKIISRRPFKDIYEISNVLGLGQKRMDAIIAQGNVEV
jgi:DNA uptake protein ComE-like DNA-binding protein